MPDIGESLAERYRLDALIGRGGFATVFRARDLRLGRDIAVKVLRADLATDPAIAERFDREARALAAVSHPNVVAIHDVGSGDPATEAPPFLVMELSDGGSLADRLAASASGTLRPDQLVPILADVAAGIDALHAQGIVHRDVKPSNVLLSDGRARVADLGIATTGASELTATGTALGTLAYLAPEQLAGEPGGPASDVYGIGVLAFLGLTGRLPRPGPSVADIVAASFRPVEAVSAAQPAVGPALDEAIGRALASDPSQRPSAAELGAMLTAALEAWRDRPPAGVAGAIDAPTVIGVPVTGVAATDTAAADAAGPERSADDTAAVDAAAAGIAAAGIAGPEPSAAAPSAAELPAADLSALELAAADTVATEVAVPVVAPPVVAGRNAATASSPSTPRHDGRMAAAGAVVGALLLGLAAIFILGSGDPGGRASPSTVRGAGASPSAADAAPRTAAPADASAAPAPASAAPAPADPYADARAASERMRAATADAGGSHGLSEREAKDLNNALDRFDKALDKEDAKAARNEAKKLADRVAKHIDQRAVDDDAATRLRTASDRLVAAAGALPG